MQVSFLFFHEDEKAEESVIWINSLAFQNEWLKVKNTLLSSQLMQQGEEIFPRIHSILFEV